MQTSTGTPEAARGRAARVSVLIEQTGCSYLCSVDESLLAGLARQGLKGIPVGCVSGGCGVCKVRIVTGSVRPLGPISRAHVSVDEESAGTTLACRVAPMHDIRLRIVGKFEKSFARNLSNSSDIATKP